MSVPAEYRNGDVSLPEDVAEIKRLREDFATLYAYLVRGEGKGPIRYIEALQMCSRNASKGQ